MNLDSVVLPGVQMTLINTVAEPEAAGTNSRSVKFVDLRHPEHTVLEPVWRQLGLLYATGWALRQNASEFLHRRPKELSTVYAARCEHIDHKPHLSTALDYYTSLLFNEDPHIEPVKTSNGVSAQIDVNDPHRIFYNKFMKNCDKGGTGFVNAFRQVFNFVLLYQSAWVLVDLPAFGDDKYANRGEQEKDGAFEPFLSVFAPHQAINWEYDDYGNVKWCVFKKSTRKSEFAVPNPMVEDRWYYYDQTSYQVWSREHDASEVISPKDAMATLVAHGTHKLAKQNKCPVLQLKVADGLWLANRALLAALSHLNTDNVLGWALFMSALAMPVITGAEDIDTTASETGYISLPKDAKYSWSEPTGHSFKHLSDRIDELKEDIFRAFYLIHQGRSGRATPTAQSGVSKQLDMMPSKDVLKMFGDLLRAYMTQVLDLVSDIRGDELDWDVSGFNFKDDLSDTEVMMFTGLLQLKIPSQTLTNVIYKRLAQRAAADSSEQVLTQIFSEIAAAKAPLDRELDEMQKRGTIQAKLTAMESDATDVGMDAGEDGSTGSA